MASAWKISRAQVEGFLNSLIKKYEVYAPARKGNQYSFQPVSSAAEAALDYDTTILPPRKFFLDPREPLFYYSKPGAEPRIVQDPIKPRVVFGIHVYDLHGIGVLKSVFMGEDQPDPYFINRYNQTYLVGIDHQDDLYKFVPEMKSHGLNCEYDLFLGADGPNYILLKGRDGGNDLLKELKDKLEPLSDKELEAYLKQREERFNRPNRKLLAGVEELPTVLAQTQESAVWQQEGDKCFSCGSCNTTCPTCYCFDIRDLPAIDSPGGRRIRSWDSCMLDVFAKVATGENFRETAALRLKHRFNRKVWYLREKYGRTACIGCGRCSRACKAEINIVNVLNKLKEEYNVACAINRR